MPPLADRLPQRARDHGAALIATSAIAASFLVLGFPPEFAAFVFRGGARVLAYNAALALLVPTLLLAWLALGSLCCRLARARLPESAELLHAALAGSAVMSLAGFALGTAGLLRPPLVVALLLASCYLSLLYGRARLAAAWRRLCRWLAAEELAAGAEGEAQPRALVASLRVAIFLVLVAITLAGAAFFDADNTDVLQFYIPYLAEVHRQHGIWLAPDRPIYLDFLVGRGNGVYLIGAALANGLVGHAVSAAYFPLLLFLARGFVARALATGGRPRAPRGLEALLPDLVMLLVAALIWRGIPFGKYYLQTTVWFVGLLYGCLHYLSLPPEERRAHFALLLPLAAAIPLSLPQYQAVSTGILAIAAGGLALRGERPWDRRLLLLLAVGVVVCLASLAFNWAYIGVPELAPYWLFEPLIVPRIFRHFGSAAALAYTNYIQGYTSSFLEIRPRADAAVPMPAALSAALAWLTAAGEVLLVAAAISALRAAIPTNWPRDAGTGAVFGIALAILALAALAQMRAEEVPLHLRYLAAQGALLGVAAAAAGAWLVGGSRAPANGGGHGHVRLFALGLAAYLLLAALLSALVRSGSLARLMAASLDLLPSLGVIVAALFARRLSGQDATGARSAGQGTRRAAAALLASALPAAALAALAALYAAWNAPTTTFAAYRVAALWLGMAAGLGAAWWLGTRLKALAPALLETVAALCLISAGVELVYAARQHPPLAVARYLAGLEGREASIVAPPRPFDKCLEIARAVPGQAAVLNLNGYSSLAYCMFSPLLPRNKLVEQYESVFAQHFRDAVFSPPERARMLYRSLGIDYFLIEKNNIDFWGPGLSPLMDDAELERSFDLYAETPSFYVLTWRGHGRSPLPLPVIAQIERWRHEGLQREGFMVGDVLLGHWRALLWMGMERPAYAPGETITFGKGGNSGLYLERGWSSPDESGTWTLSPEVELVLNLDRVPQAAMPLTVLAQAFTPSERPALEVSVVVNGTAVAEWRFAAGELEHPRTALIPADVLKLKAPLHLAFRFSGLASPRELGLSSDPRLLGLFVKSLRLGE